MNQIPTLTIELISRPSNFFKKAAEELPVWNFALIVYGLTLVAASLFYSLKPEGFPPEGFSASIGRRSMGFWILISLAGAVLTAAEAFLVILLLRFQEGKWKIGLPKTLYIFMVCHVWYFILVCFLAIAAALRWEIFYKTSELAFSLLGFIYTVSGLKITAHTTVPKVFVSLLLSSLAIMATLIGLTATGLIPSEILKVLLFL